MNRVGLKKDCAAEMGRKATGPKMTEPAAIDATAQVKSEVEPLDAWDENGGTPEHLGSTIASPNVAMTLVSCISMSVTR